MSGNLCRCGAYNGIVDAIRSMAGGGGPVRPFAYVSAPDVATAVRAIATEPDAKLLGGGTNLVDLMRAGHRAAGRRSSTSPGCR